jgi:hypothetical protein
MLDMERRRCHREGSVKLIINIEKLKIETRLEGSLIRGLVERYKWMVLLGE